MKNNSVKNLCYNIFMDKWKIFHKVLGVIFIVVGIISYITPIPGSTLLIILGTIWLIGKKRTLHFFREFLGKKVFKSLRIKKVVEKL